MLARDRANLRRFFTSFLVFVLGVAAGRARADWHIETVDSTGNVGYYPSLAVDANGNPHLAYYDQTSDQVKYAKRVDGIWQVEFISAQPGAYPSLALDSQGRPHISWNRSAWHAEPVMYTYWDGTQWITQEIPSLGLLGRNNRSSLALTADGLPRLAVLPTGTENWTDRLVYLAWDGVAWSGTQLSSGGWQAGRPKIALDANDNPRIAWPCTNGVAYYLRYYWPDGASWSSEDITSSLWSQSLYDPAALALEANGIPHAVFMSPAALTHALRTGSGWSSETIIAEIAYTPSVAMDVFGHAHVAYYYASQLKYVHRTAASWDAPQTVAGPSPVIGANPSIAVDLSGNPHIAYFDSTNADLKYAWREPPVGACCFLNGACTQMPEADCLHLYGAWQGDGSACAPNPCLQPLVIETVTVGNPGNAADTSGRGAVDYMYDIGKYEVTAGQYTEFLNAVAATDTYGLYSTAMGDPSGAYGCNIQRSGSPGSYTYGVAANWADRPVNYVSWGDAARFANWMHNGQPAGPQGLGTTEDGSYFLNGAMTDPELLAITRAADATWVIPSENEWYKAAYHKNDGVTGNYWDYPMGGSAVPNNGNPGGDTGNSANFYDGDFTIGSPYSRTEVGHFGLSDSPHGTFDQGGNVWEWNQENNSLESGIRGGSFFCIIDMHWALHADHQAYMAFHNRV